MVRGIIGTENIAYRTKPLGFQVIYGKKVLGTGKTLIEALMMRDWCREHNWIKYAGGLRYIQKIGNSYIIHKDNKHYGSFKTLMACMEERDCLVKYNWNFDLMVEME